MRLGNIFFLAFFNIAAANFLELSTNSPFLTNPDHFLIHALPECLDTIIFNLKSHQISRLQLVVFSNISTTYGSELYFKTSQSVKYSRLINILILPSPIFPNLTNSLKSRPWVANDPATVVLILQIENDPGTFVPRWGALLILRELPSFKIFLQISKATSKIQAEFLYCNKYCKAPTSSTVHPKTGISTQQILNQPLNYHRKLFRVGSGGQIPAWLSVACGEYMKMFLQNPDLVDGSRKYLHSSNAVAACRGPTLLTSVTLQSLHNITIMTYSSGEILMLKALKIQLGQFIMGEYRYSLELKVNHSQNLLYGKGTCVHILYCTNSLSKRNNFAFENWIAPFPNHVWLVILLLPVAPAVVTSCGHGFRKFLTEIWKLVKLLSLFSTDTASSYQLIYWSVLIVGVYLSNLYQNGIVSLTIAPEEHKPLRDLKDVLDYGYKLLRHRNDPQTPRSLFEWDFREYGILDRLESSFHSTFVDPIVLYMLGMISMENHALLSQTGRHAKQMMETGFNGYGFGGKPGITNCFIVPKGIQAVSLYWLIETVNRPWLMLSMQQLKEAGLPGKWDEWRLVHTEYEGGKENAKKKMKETPDVVWLSKISPILAVGALLNSIGLAIFLHEYYNLMEMLHCLTNFPAKIVGRVLLYGKGFGKETLSFGKIWVRNVAVCKRVLGKTNDMVTVLNSQRFST